MDIMGFIGGITGAVSHSAEGIAAAAIISVVGMVAGNILPKLIKTYGAKTRAWINNEIATIQDPEERALVLKAIFLAQKRLASAQGKKRMEDVIKTVQYKIPGKYDDAIVKATIQSIYDEAVTSL